jgi:microcompartment protein CcmL/EutN
MDNAAKRGGRALHSIELGSGREIGVLTSSHTGKIEAAANREAIVGACTRTANGEKSLINIQVFHRPEDIFGAFMTELTPTQPRFDMAGLSVGLVDTVDRGLLYDALHILRKYDVQLIGTRKLGSLQAFMAFAGPQAQVEAALAEIGKDAEDKITAKQRKGELYSLGIIEHPDEQILRLLPWQPASEYVITPGEGLVVPAHYYEYDPANPGSQPLAFFETLGLAHQIAIANAVLQNTGVSFVSRYGVGSGLEVFHWAFPEYEKIKRIVTPEFLAGACAGMPNTDSMLLNAVAYAQPGPAMWQVVEHLKPIPAEVRAKLSRPKDVSLGVFTARGMHATLFFLDQLKHYNVRLWGVQKSGGLLMSSVVYGKHADVRAAIERLSAQMILGIADPKTTSWTVIGNPHPDLVFALMRSIRMGV